jgi:serine/threonine-protein kinase
MDPTRLGPYTIRGRLGRGGMGTVYEGIDEAGVSVAVKTLSAHLGDDTGLRRRFEAEIEALKGLRHPGIVRLLAFGEDEGRPFFAMELVRGRSLEEILKSGRRFDWPEATAIATDIARALKAAHDQGIIHRDLKPANLLFPDEPAPGSRVKLADFGIARLFGDTGHTQAGTVVGTAEYMAPEQAAGGPVDGRVDLYALGLVIFAMLTGRPPFRGGEIVEVLRRQRSEQPPRVSVIVPEVPPAVDDLVARLLAKEPAGRPASALAVCRALATIEPLARDADRMRADRDLAVPALPRASDTPTVAMPSSEPAGVDLLAVTRITAGVADSGLTQPFTQPTSPLAASLAHRATQPSRGAAAAAAGGSRFTTVEELHQAARAEAQRTARRDHWLRLAVAGGLLAAVAAGAYTALKPVTADQLHARIRGITERPAGDLRDAGSLIEQFLARFPDDPRAAEIRELDHELQIDALDRRTRRRPRDDAALPPIERDYRAAIAREPESAVACLAALEAILSLHDGDLAADAADARPWLDLVRRQIDRVGPLADRERQEDLARAAATLAEAESLATEADGAAPPERARLAARRRELLEGLVEIYAPRPHAAEPVAEARRLLAEAEPAAD